MTGEHQVTDLRSVLKLLAETPGQLLCTDEPVDPMAELSGVYRYVGGGGTIKRPTKLGPAMVFNQIKGFPKARVAVGVLADRKRVALLLGTTPERLGFFAAEALTRPVEPITVPREKALCQQVVHLASDPGFDIRTLLPFPTNTPVDAGPFVTMGVCCGSDPETGETDITIHRLCLQDADSFTMSIAPGRHLGVFFAKAEAKGEPLPISINIGLDPAVCIAACFQAPSTPLGCNELTWAGALRRRPVEMVDCLTIKAQAIANAEIVIEGEILPGLRVAEDQHTHTGHALPEFPGYNGAANPSMPVVRIKAITHRVNPIVQTCLGPSEEHVNLAGIPTEASVISLINKAIPGFLKNVYAHSSGGGKLMAVLQVQKRTPADEGRQGQAAVLAFSAFFELKHVILVDEDVDPFDSNDVLWAMTTRFQANQSITTIPGIRCHTLDPSQDPSFNSAIRDKGLTCKAIFDATVPFALKQKFTRASFLDLDPTRFLTPSPNPLEL